MKKRIALLLIACIMLTGCQLATDEINDSGLMNEDRLVGVVVTTEHLDLFDIESFLKDNPQVLNGGTIGSMGPEYQNRIYAQEEVEHSTTEDGVPCTTVHYNFDHMEGIKLLAYQTQTILEDGSVLAETTVCTSTEGIYEARMGNGMNEGTIFVPEGEEAHFFTNPVYQDSDGRLYLVGGTGISMQEMQGSMWQTITEKRTESENGQETTSEEYGFKICVEAVTVTERVTIVQMSADNTLLNRQEFDPNEMPEELTPVEDCAYILLEEYAGDEVSRTMIEPDDRYITVYVKSDQPYCVARGTEILWPEK